MLGGTSMLVLNPSSFWYDKSVRLTVLSIVIIECWLGYSICLEFIWTLGILSDILCEYAFIRSSVLLREAVLGEKKSLRLVGF